MFLLNYNKTSIQLLINQFNNEILFSLAQLFENKKQWLESKVLVQKIWLIHCAYLKLRIYIKNNITSLMRKFLYFQKQIFAFLLDTNTLKNLN